MGDPASWKSSRACSPSWNTSYGGATELSRSGIRYRLGGSTISTGHINSLRLRFLDKSGAASTSALARCLRAKEGTGEMELCSSVVAEDAHTRVTSVRVKDK